MTMLLDADRTPARRPTRAAAMALERAAAPLRPRVAIVGLCTALLVGLAALAVATPTNAADEGSPIAWANWPLYIDIDEEEGGYPSIEAFTEQTGIEVEYTEAINDNEEFFGIVQPDLAAGNPIGYDVITPTDWMVERLARLGYLQPLDKSLLPNVEANLRDEYRGIWYDPENAFAVPYVSGVVGIAYDPNLTGREITSFDDLLDPEFAGRVGMFSEMRDTMSLALLSMGVVPEEATIEDVQAAQAKLLEAAQRGQFRDFYGNDYYDALAGGNLALSMAWGGDITQMQLYDNPNIKFVVPETGGMFYTDNMVIPKSAANVEGAHKLMDFYYDPANAALRDEYIGYFSPVTGVAEQMQEDVETARAEGDEEWAQALEVMIPGVFPTKEQLEHLYDYKILDEEEERIWNDLFNEVVVG